MTKWSALQGWFDLHEPDRLHTLASDTPSSHLYIDIQLWQKGVPLKTKAMIDSGATKNFISKSFIDTFRLSPVLQKTGPVLGIDGEEIAPASDKAIYELMLGVGRLKTNFQFRAIEMKEQRIILGMPWLKQVNPNINWRTQQVELPKHDICVLSQADFEAEAVGEICFTYDKVLQEIQRRKDKPIKLPPAYNEFADVFAEEAGQILPPHREHLDHAVDLIPGTTPPFGPLYNLSEYELEVLREYIEQNLKSGFISRSKSPAGAPILFVKKKDGSLRLCVDYRGLNAISVKDKYPIPLVSEILQRLRKAKVFTKLDLRGAYNLIRVKQGDEWKTAFRTRYGSFEYNVMPFGMANSSATFQAYINRALHDYLDVSVVVFLDDILIYSDNDEDHDRHVKEVLRRLRKHGLFAKLEKCSFSTSKVEFLGFIISYNLVEMDPERIATVTEWPRPKTVKEVQSFLGFCNFYRRFIKDYSDVAMAMTEVTGSKSPFQWTEACEKSFQNMKAEFAKSPLLIQFSPLLATIVEADSSDYAIAGVISQRDEQGHKHPIAFYSRKMKSAERNYVTHDQELLAIVEAFTVWRHYLEGAKHQIRVLSDHNNLRFFMTTKALTRRQAHWAEYLSGFDFAIEHRPGKRNPADAPSRRADYRTNEPLMLIPFFQLAKPMLAEAIAATEQLCADLGDTDADLEPLMSQTILEELAQYKGEIPQGVVRKGEHWFFGTRLYVPDGPIRLRVLRNFHDSPTAGHFGRDKTLQTMQRWFYWPDMSQTVQSYVKTCDTCQRTKSSRLTTPGELSPLPATTRPWQGISIDFMTDLPPSKSEIDDTSYDTICVIVDRFSKYCHYVPCKKEMSARQFATLFIRDVIRLRGVPDMIASDRDKLFTSFFWTSLAKMIGADHTLTTAFHQQANGQPERQNQTIRQYLRCFVSFQQDDWVTWLPLAEYAYNTSQHATTKRSPFFVCNGREAPPFQIARAIRNVSVNAEEFATEMTELHTTLANIISSEQDRQARQYDATKRKVEFKVGDEVWVKTTNLRTMRPCKKLDHEKIGPFPVLEKVNLQSYRLSLPKTMRVFPVFHVSYLEKAHPNTIPGRIEPLPPPISGIKESGAEEWEVDEILDSKYKWRKLKYLVKWKGYDNPKDNTWEPPGNLINAKAAVEDWHGRHPFKPGPENTP